MEVWWFRWCSKPPKKGWTFQVLPTAGWKSVWEVLNPRKKYPLVMKVRVCETRIHPTQKHHACFVGCSPKNSMFWLEPLWKRVRRWWKHRCDSTESSGAFPDFTVIFTCSAGVTGTIAPFILMTMGSTLSERHTFVYPVYPKQPQMNKINIGNGSRGQNSIFNKNTCHSNWYKVYNDCGSKSEAQHTKYHWKMI